MAYINSTINDNIEKKFRDTVFQEGGSKRGKYGKSIKEAMLDYIDLYSKTKSKENQKKLSNRKSG